MKKPDFRYFVLAALFLIFGQLQIASALTCDTPGKTNGSQCEFIDCECSSQVCFNGICVECASDSDCQDGKQCSNNNTCQ